MFDFYSIREIFLFVSYKLSLFIFLIALFSCICILLSMVFNCCFLLIRWHISLHVSLFLSLKFFAFKFFKSTSSCPRFVFNNFFFVIHLDFDYCRSIYTLGFISATAFHLSLVFLLSFPLRLLHSLSLWAFLFYFPSF